LLWNSHQNRIALNFVFQGDKFAKLTATLLRRGMFELEREVKL
jgi:hypothetical protein